MPGIVGIVLAGGKGLRMGGVDKAALELGGDGFLERAISALEPLAGRVAVSGRAAGRDDFAILADPIRDAGPFAGIVAGLEWAEALGAEWLLTAPVDAPFLQLSVYRQLLSAAGTEATIAHAGGRTHWLTGVWRPALAGPARAALEGGTRAVAGFLDTRDVRLLTLDDVDDMFLNVNTPDDLARARARLDEEG